MMIHKKQTKYHITWQVTFLILCLCILFSGCQTKPQSTTKIVTNNVIEITTVDDINSALVERHSSDTKVKNYQEDFPYDIINQKNRMRRAISESGLGILKKAKLMIESYFSDYEYMPDKSSWSSIFGQYQKEGNIEYRPFKIPQLRNFDSNFAFNCRISNKCIKGLKGNLILFFEADGNMNLSGDLELLKKPREKDKYFYTKESIYVYVIFVDETIG